MTPDGGGERSKTGNLEAPYPENSRTVRRAQTFAEDAVKNVQGESIRRGSGAG